MTDRSLEDSIFRLRRTTLTPNVQRIVDEAANLIPEGKQAEAAALIEKAEALAGTNHVGENHVAENRVAESRVEHRTDSKTIAHITEKLAAGQAALLAGAFQELEEHLAAESRKLTEPIHRRLEKLQHSVDGAVEQYNALAKEVVMLRQAEVKRDTEIHEIRSHAGQMTAEIGKHDEALTAIKTAFAEETRKMSAIIEKIDAQAELIGFLHDSELQRATALERALEAFSQLKSPLRARAHTAS